ncbi:MAG: magnesium transporter [Bacteroidales bacterium]|jgi:magnesium transporter
MENSEKRPFEQEQIFHSAILDLIQNHLSDADFYQKIQEFHPYDLSLALPEITKNQRVRFFTTLPADFVAVIFEHLEQDEAIDFIREIPIPQAVSILDEMESDSAVDLLQYLEAEDEDTDLVNQLSPKKRSELKKFWNYKDNEVGSVMSNSFIEIPSSMPVKDAMRKVTGIAGDTDYISILFIVDKQKLVGYLKLKQLIIARSTDTIPDIMETRFVTAHPADNKEEVARLMQDYGLSSIPIIDEDHRMVGIVTYDVMMDIIAEVQSEDYAKLAGLGSGDIETQNENVFTSVKSRLPWLLILLILSMVTSVILSFFEEALNESAEARLLAASLAIFMPLILDMSGNSGTQSLAVMIRYLVANKKEMTKKSIRRHLKREIGAGIAQGLMIGLLTFLVIYVSKIMAQGFILDSKTWTYAIVTSLAIFVALAVSNILGALIPLLMNFLKFDPAVASGPFITTVADVVALVVYYSVSLAVLLPLYS